VEATVATPPSLVRSVRSLDPDMCVAGAMLHRWCAQRVSKHAILTNAQAGCNETASITSLTAGKKDAG